MSNLIMNRRNAFIGGVAMGFIAIGVGCFAQYIMRIPDATTWAGTVGIVLAAWFVSSTQTRAE